MNADPKFSAALMHEPTDPAASTPTLVSRSLFDTLSHTLGASRVEADATHQYVTFNGNDYVCALAPVGGAA